MVIVIDDGVATLTYDKRTHECTLKDHASEAVTGRYNTRGTVHRVARGVCRIDGFDDYMSLRQMCLLVRLLKQLGFATAYRRHNESHRPWGEVVTNGFWAGHVAIDVSRMPTTTESAP